MEITLNSVKYEIIGDVQRRQINDWPPPVPSSGAQDAKDRYLRNRLGIQDIRCAFAHQVELRFDEHAGLLDHLADSNVDTRWGPIYAAPAENNPSIPTETNAGSSLYAAPTDDNSQPGAVAKANCNPKAWRDYRGTTNSGIFSWRTVDSGANLYDLDVLRWTSTAWTNEATQVQGAQSALETIAGYDMEEHKGSLYLYYSLRNPINSAGVLSVSTNGDTFANAANSPAGHARSGSRLKSHGGTLYALIQVGVGTGTKDTITVESSTDPATTVFTVRTTGAAGVLRDVELFYDWVTENEEIFVMTENALYSYDTTNYVFRHRFSLPARGRAMLPFRVNGQRALLLVMDAGRVEALLEDGTRLDISPGGVQGMPSGKDFGPAAEGQVCVAATGAYAYFLFSGLDTAGSNQRPLILAFDGTVGFRDGKVVWAGWHFIWRDAAARVPWAARLLAYDPVSGDLLAAVQRATAEDTTLLRFKDIDVNPELQGTLDRSAASQTFTTPRLDFGAADLSATIWDCFFHTNGLGTGKTLAVAYRIDGSTGSYTTVGSATTADNDTLVFPDDSATAVGLNFRDVQLQFTLDPNAVTDNIKVYSLAVAYLLVPPVRWLYIVDIDVDASRRKDQTSVKNSVTISALTTVIGSATKVALVYADLTTTVKAIPESQVTERIIASLQPVAGAGERGGVWRLFLAEV